MKRSIAIIAPMLALAVALAMPLASAQSTPFQVTPYSNSTQVGYHITNISTYGKTSVAIGVSTYNITQNYITPNESGETVNGQSYDLDLNVPVLVYGQNASYLELIKVNYIPELHTVDFNIYQLQPQSTTTTVSATSVRPTSLRSTTTILPTISTSTVTSSTTTVQQSLGSSVSDIFQGIISFFESLFSHV